jgi:polar amino acid transport system substrate-binding protein
LSISASERVAAVSPWAEFQYYDDDAASTLALQSGRADLTFGPNASAAYKAAQDGKRTT